jgi:hypothetical protein
MNVKFFNHSVPCQLRCRLLNRYHNHVIVEAIGEVPDLIMELAIEDVVAVQFETIEELKAMIGTPTPPKEGEEEGEEEGGDEHE